MNKDIEMAKNVWVLELGHQDTVLNICTLYDAIQLNRSTRNLENTWTIIDCSTSEEMITELCEEFHKQHWDERTGKYR